MYLAEHFTIFALQQEEYVAVKASIVLRRISLVRQQARLDLVTIQNSFHYIFYVIVKVS